MKIERMTAAASWEGQLPLVPGICRECSDADVGEVNCRLRAVCCGFVQRNGAETIRERVEHYACLYRIERASYRPRRGLVSDETLPICRCSKLVRGGSCSRSELRDLTIASQTCTPATSQVTPPHPILILPSSALHLQLLRCSKQPISSSPLSIQLRADRADGVKRSHVPNATRVCLRVNLSDWRSSQSPTFRAAYCQT